MQLAYTINLTIHALAGLAALVALPVPLIAKKGGATHRKAGWVFVVAMMVIAATGLLISLAWGLVPLTVKPPSRPLSPEAIVRVEQTYRGFALFFATVAVISLAAVWHGMSALRLRRVQHDEWASPLDHLSYAATVVMGAALLRLGLAEGMTLFIVFGALALFGGLGDAHFVLRGRRRPNAWLIRHLQSMLGGATAALTAFTAFTVRRYFGGEYSFAALAWLLPVVLGSVASWVWTRHYRKRSELRGV